MSNTLNGIVNDMCSLIAHIDSSDAIANPGACNVRNRAYAFADAIRNHASSYCCPQLPINGTMLGGPLTSYADVMREYKEIMALGAAI